MLRNIPREGTPRSSWWGCAARISKSSNDSNTRFQTRPLKSIPVFRPDIYVYKGFNYVTIAKVRTPTTDLLKFSSNDLFWLFLFLSCSFRFEKTNRFIRSRGSLENHTRFQTIMVKIYTRFRAKTAQKPYPLGRHIPI